MALHYLEVRTKASKTDPFKRGVSVFLSKTGRGEMPSGSNGEKGSGRRPRDGQLLTRERFVTAVRRVLEQAGLDASSYMGQNQGSHNRDQERYPGFSH